MKLAIKLSTAALGLAIAGVLSGCTKANVLSRDEEIRLGRQASAEVEKKYQVSRNPADVDLVNRLGQRMVAASNLKWPYTFKVLNDKSVNAFSLPGGPVYVFRGLLDLTAGNEDQLSSVIAHEIGHIENRHVAKMYTQGVFTDILISLGTRGNVQTAAQIAQVFMQMRFSREDEYQADSSGIKYAYKAGYDPQGMIVFFQKMQRLQKEGKGDILSNNLRTHPLTSNRIERAKREIAKIQQQVNRESENAYMLLHK